MEQILLAYGFSKETVTAIRMLYMKTWKQWFAHMIETLDFLDKEEAEMIKCFKSSPVPGP